MRGTERVIGAFRPLRESAQPVLLPKRPDPVPAARQDLVGIALVAHIPDDPVLRRLEHGMKRHGQFHDAQPGTQMPAGLADRVEDGADDADADERNLRPAGRVARDASHEPLAVGYVALGQRHLAAAARRLDRVCRVLFPVFFALITYLTLLT